MMLRIKPLNGLLGAKLDQIIATPPVQVTQDQINEAVYQALKRVFSAPAS